MYETHYCIYLIELELVEATWHVQYQVTQLSVTCSESESKKINNTQKADIAVRERVEWE